MTETQATEIIARLGDLQAYCAFLCEVAIGLVVLGLIRAFGNAPR